MRLKIEFEYNGSVIQKSYEGENYGHAIELWSGMPQQIRDLIGSLQSKDFNIAVPTLRSMGMSWKDISMITNYSVDKLRKTYGTPEEKKFSAFS